MNRMTCALQIISYLIQQELAYSCTDGATNQSDNQVISLKMRFC